MLKHIIAGLCVSGFLMVVLSGPAYRFAGLPLNVAFSLLQYGLVVAGAGLILIILQLIVARKTVQPGRTTLYALLAFTGVLLPVNMMVKSYTSPAIHDISTDVTNPPRFAAIASLRDDTDNPVIYEGSDLTRQQLDAYPEIQTVKLPHPVDDVFTASKQAVAALGWTVVHANASSYVVEATTTSLWFGFKDDVIVRLTADNNHTLVDVRSQSRIGNSDLGRNAEHIIKFMEALRTQLTRS